LKLLAGELLRFCIIGVIVAIVQIGSYTLLANWLGLAQTGSGTIAYVAGVTVHFMLNRRVTFSSKSSITFLQLVRYGGLLLLNYLVTLLCLWLASDLFHVLAQVGLLASLAITALISFFVMKYFIFPAEATEARV